MSGETGRGEQIERKRIHEFMVNKDERVNLLDFVVYFIIYCLISWRVCVFMCGIYKCDGLDAIFVVVFL